MTARYQFTTALWLALDSIRAHKLRSFLTLLGIIIGVASVITVGAAIDGLGVYAEQTTAKTFGSDSFLIAQIASVGQMTRKQYAAKVRRKKTDPSCGSRIPSLSHRRHHDLQSLRAAL